MSIVVSNPEPDRWELGHAESTARQPGWGARPARKSAESRLEACAPRRIAFIVNGDETSAMAQRAQAFARHMRQQDIRIAYRSANKVVSIFAFLWFLLLARPAVTYVFDISYSGVLAAALYRLVFDNRLVIDTGDAITELARSMGRGRIGVLFTSLLEKFALSVADRMIVRGTFHRVLLARADNDAEVVQDGVDISSFAAEDVRELRKQNGLEGVLTVGLVGSSVWSEKLQMCYGWELVETIRLLQDKPVRGIMIGGGSGIAHLKARCREYGIEDRVFFLDRVPFAQLPRYLSLLDVCLSTQTNDVAGNVRTTGKLPLYLATGRFILASNVGEASSVLPKEMLVDYVGVKDEGYPAQLAARIESILAYPQILSSGAANVSRARQHFDYSMLAQRAHRVIKEVLKES
jgi:glycosyltransferase involved in cell wall biosynthesis